MVKLYCYFARVDAFVRCPVFGANIYFSSQQTNKKLFAEIKEMDVEAT